MQYFSLTDDLLSMVCSEWLSVEELCVFDTACTNHKLRTQYMQAVQQGKHETQICHKNNKQFYEVRTVGLIVEKMRFVWRLGYIIRKLECSGGKTLHDMLTLLSHAETTLLISKLRYVVLFVDESLPSNCLAFLDLAVADVINNLSQLEIHYGDCDHPAPASFPFEDIRQADDQYKYNNQLSNVSFHLTVDVSGFEELFRHCELSWFNSITLLTSNYEYSRVPFGELPDHLVGRLGCFSGQLRLPDRHEEEDVYYWAELFLQHCPSLQSLTLDATRYDHLWREIFRHPKVVVDSWMLAQFDEEEYPAEELQSMLHFLQGAKMGEFRVMIPCDFVDDTFLQSIISANSTTLTALHLHQPSGVSSALYRSILQMDLPLLTSVAFNLYKLGDTSLSGIFADDMEPAPARLKRNLKDLRLFNNTYQQQSNTNNAAAGIIHFLQQGFRSVISLDISLVLFTTEEMNHIFSHCPFLQAFTLNDHRFNVNEPRVTELPVIDEFPTQFCYSITACHFHFPAYSTAFVLQLLKVSNLRRLGGAFPNFTVRMFEPENAVWDQVRAVQAGTKGGPFVRLLSRNL